jgi:hypothetical protein
MKLWILILATLVSLPIAEYLVKRKGFSRTKAVLLSVGIVWATVILITMLTVE